MDVFIADDSPVVRERLASMLSDIDGIRMVGEAGDIQSAVEGVRRLQPHTLILDVELPGGTGIDVLKALAGMEPMPRVIMLTNNPQPAYREKCRRLGAEFFFDKTLEFEKVAQVLRVLRATVATAANSVPDVAASEGDSSPAGSPAPVAAANSWIDRLQLQASAIARQVCGVENAYLRLSSADFPWLPTLAPCHAEESLLYANLTNETIATRELQVLDDVLRDPRSSAGILACGDGPMRFYAAVPLLLDDGSCVGALTVLGRDPHSLGPNQRQALWATAHQTASNLERARLEYEQARREADAIHRPATRDALTGLQNRAALNESILRGIAHANRSAEKLAFLYIDIDHFRQVNETVGREFGDALLVEAGKRLLAAVRGADTVARLGGDEFAVLAAGLRGVEDAAIVAQKLHRTLCLPFASNGQHCTPSCSIGVSLFPVDGNDSESLLRHADAAMFRAKCGGRGGYELFTVPGAPRLAS